ELGEDLGQGLADDAAPIDRHTVLAAEQEAGVLEVHQLVGGAVEGDLLLVALAPARDPLGRLPVVPLGPFLGRLLGTAAPALLDRGDAEQLVGPGQARPTLPYAKTPLARPRDAH